MGHDHDDEHHHRHRPHNHAPTNITHAPEVAPPPGKTTGIPLIDEGLACHPHDKREHIPRSGCLDDDQVPALLASYLTACTTAMGNFRAALAAEITELLTTAQVSSTWWGLVAEISCGSGLGVLLGMATKSAGRFIGSVANVVAEGGVVHVAGYQISGKALELLSHVQLKHVTNVLVQVAKGTRTMIKNASYHKPSGPTVASAANVDKANFLDRIDNELSGMTNTLVMQAPSLMKNDAELVAMTVGYMDMTYHSKEAYRTAIKEFLAKYSGSKIADVGDGKCLGEDEQGNRQMETVKHAVLVKAGGRSRMAVIEVYDPIYAKDQPTKGYDGQRVAWEQPEFIAWVDDDLRQYGEDFENERNGVMSTLDASAGTTGMKPIDSWALDKGWGTREAAP